MPASASSRPRARLLLLVGLMALCALPAVALASAAPKKNGIYCINCTAKSSPGQLHISKAGTSIDGLTYYNDCSRVPVPSFVTTKIAIRKGAFSAKKSGKNVLQQPITLTIKGKFTSAKVITGTIGASSPDKTCKPVKFTAKFTQSGPLQP